ncbi:MAG: hypothetical protein J6I96_03715 [Oscillospiraceae bacterium]|nr:hypothetical protein [Oscillospiraceae bacterium]
MFDKLYIRSQHDLEDAIEKYGIIPYFRNSIDGFSIEEHIAPECWFSEEEGAWEWKGPVIKSTGCAYGKFFEKKAAYVRADLFCELANYRRDGYDFDARYDDGLARYSDKALYDLIDELAPVISKRLKKEGGYGKNGVKGFDTSIARLQYQCYVITDDFVYMTDRNGSRYGWGVAEYSTPEKLFGAEFTDRVYAHSSDESYELLFDHIKSLFPSVPDERIGRFLR